MFNICRPHYMLACLGKSKCKYEYNTVEELNNVSSRHLQSPSILSKINPRLKVKDVQNAHGISPSKKKAIHTLVFIASSRVPNKEQLYASMVQSKKQNNAQVDELLREVNLELELEKIDKRLERIRQKELDDRLKALKQPGGSVAKTKAKTSPTTKKQTKTAKRVLA